jgi:hypothetical protein
VDTAVGLVQAYLRVNGYFTVAEYAVLDATGTGGPRTVTDLDILAVRLHHALGDDPDPVLGARPGVPDMIVGEVKEGAPKLNPAMRDPAVLEAAFARFGCCAASDAPGLVQELLRTGQVVAPEGHLIRTVAFGNTTHPNRSGNWHTVPLEHILDYLRQYLQHNWATVGRTQIKDDTLGLLALMEKAHRAGGRTR